MADGRGFLGGWWFLPGPWLEPGFRTKGYEDIDERRHEVKELIGMFNSMVASLPGVPDFDHVVYHDFRPDLPNDSTYKRYWENELHPTSLGFRKVTDKLHETLRGLP